MPADDPVLSKSKRRVKLTGLLSGHGAVEDVHVKDYPFRPWAIVTLQDGEPADTLIRTGMCTVTQYNLLAWRTNSDVRACLAFHKDQHAVQARLPPGTYRDAYVADLMQGLGVVCW
ncbi:hypothetical protein RI367_000007 [Sorochytrium milnesiophthora]